MFAAGADIGASATAGLAGPTVAADLIGTAIGVPAGADISAAVAATRLAGPVREAAGSIDAVGGLASGPGADGLEVNGSAGLGVGMLEGWLLTLLPPPSPPPPPSPAVEASQPEAVWHDRPGNVWRAPMVAAGAAAPFLGDAAAAPEALGAAAATSPLLPAVAAVTSAAAAPVLLGAWDPFVQFLRERRRLTVEELGMEGCLPPRLLQQVCGGEWARGGVGRRGKWRSLAWRAACLPDCWSRWDWMGRDWMGQRRNVEVKGGGTES